MLVPDAEEAAKTQDGVRDAAGLLVDHHVDEFTESCSRGVVDGGSRDSRSGDQTVDGLTCFGHLNLRSNEKWAARSRRAARASAPRRRGTPRYLFNVATTRRFQTCL